MPAACPACHSRGPHRQIARPEYPSSAPVFFGGPVLALFVAVARKRAFLCGRCGAAFLAHTASSRFFLGFLLLLLALLVLYALVVVLLAALRF